LKKKHPDKSYAGKKRGQRGEEGYDEQHSLVFPRHPWFKGKEKGTSAEIEKGPRTARTKPP